MASYEKIKIYFDKDDDDFVLVEQYTKKPKKKRCKYCIYWCKKCINNIDHDKCKYNVKYPPCYHKCYYRECLI